MERQDFANLIKSQHARLYAMALRITGNPDDARDALQNSYLKLWENRHALLNVEKREAYFTVVVKSCAVSLLRTRRPCVSISGAFIPEAEIPPETDGVADRDAIDKAMHCIAKLPDNMQTVMKLHIFKGLNCKEISELTGQTHANVRQMLSRARQKLRDYQK